MKLCLINPKFPETFLGLEHVRQVVGKRYVAPPLPLLTIAALTPSTIEVEICDENVHPIPWETDAQVIALTGIDLQRPRLLDIARAFRARGKQIVVGGVSVTGMPGWYRDDADVLIRGEAEYVWPQFLRDLQDGVPQAEYVQTDPVDLQDSPIPRYELVNMRDYMYAGFQTTRGCPFECEFCDIITLYGRKVRRKPVDQVLEEVERLVSLGVKQLNVIDDNLIGDRKHAYALMEGLRRFNRRLRRPPRFSCQATVNVADDPALLRLMREAGVRMVFIGVETPNAASLTEIRKHQNVRADLLRDIEMVQSHGIGVMVGTVVGFDHDDETIFDQQIRFLTRARITMIYPSQLAALPGTPLYRRLREAGRLREEIQWQEDGRYIESNFTPQRMTNEQLTAGFLDMLLRLYEPQAFAIRLRGELEWIDRVPEASSKRVWPSWPIIALAFGWVGMWCALGAHRRALLRVFRTIAPYALVRHPRVAHIALARLLFYCHIYSLIHRWQAIHEQEPSTPVPEEPAVSGAGLLRPVHALT